MKSLNYLEKVIVMIFFMFISCNLAYSQSESGRMSFGFNAGTVKYWGEFSDNKVWLGRDLFLKCNILPQVYIMVIAGLTQANLINEIIAEISFNLKFNNSKSMRYIFNP